MENLEEVLQALDEFQKMRPTEIPRELEDYLCWVAKTGDPVYQWSLIKTLFREKLTRVMTDFYESCPSLELAPCPNVEHFNYDTMKSNLLERLESFANAPFTVQRICELLTAPRKEYNRVDKFMRAIEKNILVVSTREPGPIARRSENGDSMVNGSVEDESGVTQPPQDVEMEYWEKDCASTVTISVHTMDSEAPLLHTVIPTETAVKNVFETEESAQEKSEQSVSNRTEVAVSNFSPSTSEFGNVANINPQAQSQDASVVSGVQSMSTIVPETSGIVGDVPEAIMNEDTSSQPSLDLENEDCDSADSSRKLQTTFQAKDFTTNDAKSKFYIENKQNEKMEAEAPLEATNDSATKTNDTEKDNLEHKIETSSKESISPMVESLLKATSSKVTDKCKLENDECPQVSTDENTIEAAGDKEMLATGSTDVENSCVTGDTEQIKTSVKLDESSADEPAENSPNPSIISSNQESVSRISQTEPESKGTSVRNTESEPTGPEPVAIIEEPPTKDNGTKENCDPEKDNLTIVEAGEDDSRIIKSLVPDPIPIVEEPKDTETLSKNSDNRPTAVEVLEESDDVCSTKYPTSVEEKLKTIESENLEELRENDVANKVRNEESTAMVNPAQKQECGSVELMDVDEDEPLSMFRQDEPMEQETTELAKS